MGWTAAPVLEAPVALAAGSVYAAWPDDTHIDTSALTETVFTAPAVALVTAVSSNLTVDPTQAMNLTWVVKVAGVQVATGSVTLPAAGIQPAIFSWAPSGGALLAEGQTLEVSVDTGAGTDCVLFNNPTDGYSRTLTQYQDVTT